MKIIDIGLLDVPPRQRETINPIPLASLRESILARGLLQAPVVRGVGSRYTLVVGERRLRAIQTLQADGRSFIHDGITIQPGQLPITTLAEYLDEVGQFEAEFDENIQREDLTWQERAKALAKLHELRSAQNPKQTVAETAEELVERRAESATPIGFEHARRHLRESLVVAANLHDPHISKARNLNEAYTQVLLRDEKLLMAAIAKRERETGTSVQPIEIRCADMITELPRLPDSFVDLIIADPPYGLDYDRVNERLTQQHNYGDDIDSAKRIVQTIFTEGFRVCRPRANLFVFCHPRMWNWLHDMAANMGWTVFPAPIQWQKSESEGTAPWMGAGFRRTYDSILYATKGRKGLHYAPVDILSVKRVPRTERVHGAEKPVDLLKLLIDCSTLRGDYVLDPCCGSGSALVAARELGRVGLGIEKDQNYANIALANVHNGGNDARSTSRPEAMVLPAAP